MILYHYFSRRAKNLILFFFSSGVQGGFPARGAVNPCFELSFNTINFLFFNSKEVTETDAIKTRLDVKILV